MESALFIAATGMKGLSQGMQVTTNNLANVSTIGYKQQQILYSDLIYTGQSDSQGNMGNWWCTQEDSRVAIGQVGHGLQVESIRTLFQQSAFESSNTLTDMAINGKGFFIVKDANGNDFYTRAGDFRSDNQGVWRMPDGHALQAYKVSEDGTTSNSLQDVQVDPATDMQAKATARVQATFNINPYDDNTHSLENPFFSLLQQYNATSSGRPLAKDATSYEEGVTVYDADGRSHTLNFFFDAVANNATNAAKVAEYDSDGARVYRDADGIRVFPVQENGQLDKNGAEINIGDYLDEDGIKITSEERLEKIAPALKDVSVKYNAANMTEYDSYGALVYRDANGIRVFPVEEDGYRDKNDEEIKIGDFLDENGYKLSAERLAGISISVNNSTTKYVEFLIAEDSSTLPVQYDENGVKIDRRSTDGLLMSGILEFSSSGEILSVSAYTPTGDANTDLKDLQNWIPATGTPPTLNMNGVQIAIDFGVSGYATNTNYAQNAAEVGSDPRNLISHGDENSVRTQEAASAFDGMSPTGYFLQNGYPQGSLSNLSVDKNGYVIGHYSNGQDMKLWQIPIANFTSEAGLYREGSNLFGYTQECGQTYIGMAGTGNYGSINAYNIETSNVDYATEMVNMIVTQRGFQSNSKVITTQNEMLQTAIQLKRA